MKKPNFKDFHTDSGLHQAMADYADSFKKKALLVKVVYNDGSVDENFCTFKRAQKPIEYRTADGEIYEVYADTSKFEPDFLPKYNDPLTVSELKAAVKAWFHYDARIVYKSIDFVYVPE